MQQQRADRTPIIIFHDHVPIEEDLSRLKQGGVTAKFFNISVDTEISSSYRESGVRFEGWTRQALEGFDRVYTAVEKNSDEVSIARSAVDIEAALDSGKIAVVIASEGGKILEGSLGPLRIFHRMGLRHMQLTWSFANQIADSQGLTDFGRKVVRQMNQLGIIVDVTHLFEKAFEQVVELSDAPVVVSHGAAAGVTRDLSDRKLEAIAATGGLVGIHFYCTYLVRKGAGGSYNMDFGPKQVAEQAQYISRIVGAEHVALGCDFFPTTGHWRDFQDAQGTEKPRWAIAGPDEMPLIAQALSEAGLSPGDVGAILGGNVLRLCREVWGG